MQVIDLNKVDYKIDLIGTGIALGNFDGIHRGHKELIKNMIEGSKERNLKSSVLLFNNHTKFLLDKGKDVKILSSNKEKLEILEEIGIDIVFFIDFNEELMKLSGLEFVENLLMERLNVKYITVGFDYRFGYKAKYTSKDLYNMSIDLGIETNIIDAIYVEDHLISSTLIRKLITEGNILEANNYLGRPYKLLGKVIHGKNRGHKLGFPTANLGLEDPFVIPRAGVYDTNTIIDGICYKSLTNIGNNPTFNDEEITIETYIIDFNNDIYGKEIEIEFNEFIREDIKFDSEELLIKQMNLDLDYIVNK